MYRVAGARRPRHASHTRSILKSVRERRSRPTQQQTTPTESESQETRVDQHFGKGYVNGTRAVAFKVRPFSRVFALGTERSFVRPSASCEEGEPGGFRREIRSPCLHSSMACLSLASSSAHASLASNSSLRIMTSSCDSLNVKYQASNTLQHAFPCLCRRKTRNRRAGFELFVGGSQEPPPKLTLTPGVPACRITVVPPKHCANASLVVGTSHLLALFALACLVISCCLVSSRHIK